MQEYNRLLDSARRLYDANKIMLSCLDKTRCCIEISREFSDWSKISFPLVDEKRNQLVKAIQEFEDYNSFINEYIEFLQTFGENVMRFEEEIMRAVSEIPVI